MDKEPPLWPWSSMSTIYDPNEENVDNMPNMGEDIIDGNVTFRRRFKLKTNQHRPNRTSSVKKSSDLKTTATMKLLRDSGIASSDNTFPEKLEVTTKRTNGEYTAILGNWTIFLNSSGELILKGKPNGLNEILTTRPIQKRISSTRVMSEDNHTYILQGPPVRDKNLPIILSNRFSNGFPKDWLTIIEEWKMFSKKSNLMTPPKAVQSNGTSKNIEPLNCPTINQESPQKTQMHKPPQAPFESISNTQENDPLHPKHGESNAVVTTHCRSNIIEANDDMSFANNVKLCYTLSKFIKSDKMPLVTNKLLDDNCPDDFVLLMINFLRHMWDLDPHQSADTQKQAWMTNSLNLIAEHENSKVEKNTAVPDKIISKVCKNVETQTCSMLTLRNNTEEKSPSHANEKEIVAAVDFPNKITDEVKESDENVMESLRLEESDATNISIEKKNAGSKMLENVPVKRKYEQMMKAKANSSQKDLVSAEMSDDSSTSEEEIIKPKLLRTESSSQKEGGLNTKHGNPEIQKKRLSSPEKKRESSSSAGTRKIKSKSTESGDIKLDKKGVGKSNVEVEVESKGVNDGVNSSLDEQTNNVVHGSLKNPKKIEEWKPKLDLKNCQLYFEGYLNRANKRRQKICTDFIARAMNKQLLETVKNEYIELVGNYEGKADEVPEVIARIFKNGCSEDIPSLCKKWKNLRNTKNLPKKKESKKYETDSSISSTYSGCISKRGRHLVPPLNFWEGKRANQIHSSCDQVADEKQQKRSKKPPEKIENEKKHLSKNQRQTKPRSTSTTKSRAKQTTKTTLLKNKTVMIYGKELESEFHLSDDLSE